MKTLRWIGVMTTLLLVVPGVWAAGITRTEIRATPAQSLNQIVADIPPGALATITAAPGDYLIATNTASLLKNGVNWHFENGARILTGNSSDTTGRRLFDDWSGAVTSTITGFGEFYMTNSKGVILNCTNPSSSVRFSCSTLSSSGTNTYITSSNVTVSVSPVSAGFSERTRYYNVSQSNDFFYAVTSAGAVNTTFLLGPGNWAFPESLVLIADNVTIKGAGRDVTVWKTQDGSSLAAFCPTNNTKVFDLTIQAHIPMTYFTPATNTYYENVAFRGNIDCWYSGGDGNLGGMLVAAFRNCTFYSASDMIMIQFADPSSWVTFDSCTFFADAKLDTLGEFPARSIHVFYVTQGTVYARNCNLVHSNALDVAMFYHRDNVFSCTNCVRAYYDNCTVRGAVTNSGIVRFYGDGNGDARFYTNSIISYLNCPQVDITTNAAIYTNSHGPQILYLTSTAQVGRTNWLPDIAFGGIPRFDYTLTIKDPNGTASGSNIFIKALVPGQLVETGGTITNKTDGGSVTLKVKGTNWVVIGRGQPGG